MCKAGRKDHIQNIKYFTCKISVINIRFGYLLRAVSLFIELNWKFRTLSKAKWKRIENMPYIYPKEKLTVL